MRLPMVLLGVTLALACSESGDQTDAGTSDSGSASATCPKQLRFTYLPGNRTDIGWTGNLHGASIAADAFFIVDIVECDANCQQCAFEGPVADPVVNTQRCVANPQQTCSQDSDCPPWECRPNDVEEPNGPKSCADGSGRPCTSAAECAPPACRIFVGPSIPIPAPITCASNYFDSFDGRPPIIGNIDLRSGALTLERMLISAGGAAETAYCPQCIGDPVSNDGVKGGKCRQSPYDPPIVFTDTERECDGHGNGQQPSLAGVYSLDCSPGSNRALPQSYVNARTTGRRFELGNDQPDCGGTPCWCGICDGTYEACHRHGDCSGGKQCVAPMDLPFPIRPNGCIGTCNWDQTAQRGSCMTQDPAQGDGGLPPPRTISCFPEGTGAEVFASGSTRIVSDKTFRVEIGHLNCRPPIRDERLLAGAVRADVAIGLPGLQYSVLRFQIDQEF